MGVQLGNFTGMKNVQSDAHNGLAIQQIWKQTEFLVSFFEVRCIQRGSRALIEQVAIALGHSYGEDVGFVRRVNQLTC